MITTAEILAKYAQPVKRGISAKPVRMVWGHGRCPCKRPAYVKTEAYGLLCWTHYLENFGEQMELFDEHPF